MPHGFPALLGRLPESDNSGSRRSNEVRSARREPCERRVVNHCDSGHEFTNSQVLDSSLLVPRAVRLRRFQKLSQEARILLGENPSTGK